MRDKYIPQQHAILKIPAKCRTATNLSYSIFLESVIQLVMQSVSQSRSLGTQSSTQA